MLEGLHPNRPTHVMRLATDEASARQATELLGEVFDPGETAVAAFEADGGAWALEAYFAHEPDADALRELIRPIVGAEAERATFARLEQKDWVQAALDGLQPVRAGRFLVHGVHDKAAVRPNDLAIEIEAALAVAVARDNARLNAVAPHLRFYAAPGVRHPLARRRRRFDLVFANILARPLRRLAPALSAVLARRGTLILSGLLPRDVPGVLPAYAAQGLRLDRRLDLDGWAVLVLARGGRSPRPVR